MAESVDFILRLQDQVSGPARAAAESVRSIQSKAKTTAKALDFSAEIKRTQDAFSKLKLDPKGYTDMLKLQRQLRDERAKLAKASGAGNTFFGGFGKQLGFRSVADYAKGAFVGELAAKGVETIIGGFVSGAHAAVSLVASGIKMAFVEGGKAENLRLSYKHLLGAQGGKEALDQISGFSGKTKYDDDKIAEMMRPLFRAGLKGTGASTAFALASDANVRTGEDPSETIAGLAKIQLKGGVTEKLIVGLGLSVREFKNALAVETGTLDKEAAFKKATDGKLDPMAIQNAIVRATEQHYGTKTGTATNEAADTMSTHIEKLADLPSQYLKKMSDSPAWSALSTKLGDTLNGLSPESERGKKIIDSLFRVFDKLAGYIQSALTPENIDKFAAMAATLVDDLAKLPAVLDGIITASEILGTIWAGSTLVGGVVTLTAALPMLGTALGAIVGVAGLISAPFIAAAAAVAAVGLAIYRVNEAIKELGGSAAVLQDLKDWASGADPAVSKGNSGFAAMQEENARNLEKARQGSAPPVAAANSNAKPPVAYEHHGDINVTAAPGADAKGTADEVVKKITRQMHGDLERAMSEAGGA